MPPSHSLLTRVKGKRILKWLLYEGSGGRSISWQINTDKGAPGMPQNMTPILPLTFTESVPDMALYPCPAKDVGGSRSLLENLQICPVSIYASDGHTFLKMLDGLLGTAPVVRWK